MYYSSRPALLCVCSWMEVAGSEQAAKSAPGRTAQCQAACTAPAAQQPRAMGSAVVVVPRWQCQHWVGTELHQGHSSQAPGSAPSVAQLNFSCLLFPRRSKKSHHPLSATKRPSTLRCKNSNSKAVFFLSEQLLLGCILLRQFISFLLCV